MIRIEQLLRQTMGLHAASIGSSLLQRCVRLRMKDLGLEQADEYLRLVQNSSGEWEELIDAVIVTETWFFRDREPFTALVRLVREEWLPANDGRPVRLLSVPCSSGEEPYSLAMALLDAGLLPGRFCLDAVDISARVLARAQRALYGKNSFRGKDLAFRDRHFKWTKEGYLLNENVRQCVRFWQDNVLNKTFLQGNAAYDFTFCRNLLIYFDRPTQQVALSRIAEFLQPNGVLFVGAAEQPLVLEHGFAPANIPMAFAFRKQAQAGVTRLQSARRARRPRWTAAPDKALTLFERGPDVPPAPSPVAKPPKPGEAELEEARRLADAGRLQEASALCQRHLRECGASAQAYYLLGLVSDAEGDPGAVDFYRKALYLEPGHYESLLQMALLSQKNGDAARARTYKMRAERLKNKKAG
jgi:chemotaxis protein methyltransferase WspC